MLVEVVRLSTTSESTIGAMYVDGQWVCWTVEDTWRAVKEKGVTRIPQGRYRIGLRTQGTMHARYQERFGDIHSGMLWVQDVPEFEWIYIHVGNKATNSEGCILVGDSANSNTEEDGFVANSTETYRRVYGIICDAIEGGDTVYLRTRDIG